MIENLNFPLDYILLTIGSFVVIFCFWKGFIASVLGLLTWIGSILITIYFYIDLAYFINAQLIKIKILENYEQITNLLSNIFSIPLIFLISLFILKKLRKFISADLHKQILGIFIDKIFGFLFGFIFNYIIFSTLIYFTKNLDYINFLNHWLIENSYIMMILENYNNVILNSIFGNKEVLSN